ncbi:putative bifunctional diguanylate cyclase/phosphodiesterase [Sphingomonas melonis]|uniref:Diguanylate cyclase (GGDEF)-like protein/PAS domain S-box-containing protein n=1 Tax=Sphingomonas melonis TaxID=152682 RepID=A0A7Y9FKX2_9SPHN|nr:EAL domain-containing protein [Sphingomonas melonis]NYD89023.1 diguanylate cyclase (GGDEF)-like protein/PAS domain S-box-containing protein [Sphingomonas melonis]
MQSAPHLFNEDARLAALAEYHLMSDDPLVDVQDIVQLAVRTFDVQIALVSVVERDRQVFKAHVGIEVCETSREASFCAHAITLPAEEMLVIPDALLDIRFVGNPLVTGTPNIRFYAGVPLRSPSGHAIGTLCIIDSRPRSRFTADDQEHLRTLAAIVLDRLEVRRLAASGREDRSRFEHIAATSPDGIMCADGRGIITFWNGAAERLFGYTATEAVGADISLIVPPRMRAGHNGGFARVAAGGETRLVGTTVQLDAVRKDGIEIPIELSLSMWREGSGSSFGAIVRDMSERRRNELRLFDLAHRDSLTGLPNRTVLMSRISDCTVAGEAAAVLMIDLDGFKLINDTLGHTSGDSLLREVASRLEYAALPTDTVVRVAGDEFAIVMSTRPRLDAVAAFADRLIEQLAHPVLIDGETVHVGASIGIALFPDHGSHGEDLLAAADLAMYQAKAEGRSCHRFFRPALREAARHRRAFEGEIRGGLDRGEFKLFYQPQVRLTDGSIQGVEALLRWDHPCEGLLTPDRFLTSIESSLLAAEMGRWVLDRACADVAILRGRWSDLVVGVNLFGAQFRAGNIGEDVLRCLESHALPPEALELEITENIILRHDETMLQPLVQLRSLGVGIAFDDFGTGYASLSMLKRYPLSRIKIDRSFIQDICHDHADATIVTTLASLAHGLGLEVIAEGVETEEQRAMILACGCNVVQGYLYGKPVPRDELLAELGGSTKAA